MPRLREPPLWATESDLPDLWAALRGPDFAGAACRLHSLPIAICEFCPARQPCLEWALDHREWGIWGGTTERQRRQLRRQREAA